MTRPVLAESEYRFMDLIWDHEPISSTQLVSLCNEAFGWKKSTTYTEIKRLSQKGYLKNEDAVVRATVSREEVQAQASELFVEQTFGGSLPCFLAAFLGSKPISRKEAAELRELIDQCEEE